MDKKLEERLDLIAGLLGRMLPKRVVTKEREPIYSLCDGLHTAAEIAEKVGKSKGSVSKALERMQKENLIISFKSDFGTVYFR